MNCPNEGPNKDANDLIVDWKAEGISPEEQSERLGLLLQHAKPFVVCMAERVAEMDGPARDLGMREVSGLAAQMDGHEQAIYKEQICEVLHIGRREFKELVKASIKGETDEEDKSEPIETAGGWIRGHLVELLYDRQTMKTSFVVRYPDGKIEARHNIIIEGKKYIPIYPDSLLTRDVVLLPTRLEALRPTVELVGIIRAHLNRYFDFGSDEFFERLCAYYVMFSWVYDGFTTVPYIRALGDTGTGKSRLLDTVGNVCYRPIRITGGSSASSIFRTLDLYHGTLVLDEADFAKSDEATTIAKVLNGGNQKNRPLLRMMEAGNGKWSVQAFDVYGPKVIGTRKGFGDRAIESRCLTKETGGGVPHPRIPLELPRVFWQQAEEIRNLLLAYRMATAQEQREVDYSGVDRSVEPRLNQVTLALVTIIEDEELRTEIRGFIKDYNEQLKVERSGTMTARVLEALVQCWGRGTTTASEEINRIYLKDLAEATNEIVDEQNRQMGDEVETATVDEEGRKKKSSRMTSRRVSDTVRKYLQLKVLRATDGEKGRKGTNYVVWDQERVDALCERFGVEMVGRGSLKKQMAFGEEERGKWKALDEKNKQETMEMRSGNE